jgi:hypothetical protein
MHLATLVSERRVSKTLVRQGADLSPMALARRSAGREGAKRKPQHSIVPDVDDPDRSRRDDDVSAATETRAW